MLEVDSIKVYYGDAYIIKGVSFMVKKGEIVAVIGSNGSGKTTIMRTITGFLTPNSGFIRFLGKRIDGLSPHKIVELGLTMVPEGRQLFPLMTVKENLLTGAYPKTARKYIKSRLEFVYGLFPILKERNKQLAGSLSGGEQQMLAIARALMSNPTLLILDEPSTGLGPKIIKSVYDILERLNKDGLTILLVEQNAYAALSLANRAYVIENGVITLEGESKKLISNDLVREKYLGI